MKPILILISLLFVWPALAANPDLRTLSQSGYIMGPESSGSYGVHDNWKSMNKLMQTVNVYDDVVNRMVETLCSGNENRSILIVGEPNDSYRYVFGKLATLSQSGHPCAHLWHVDININKIEAGHSYVGQVDQYWNDKVLEPSERKNVILYFRSLGHLIGIGSHSKDDTGIERTYANNITSGQIRTVAFVNKYEYRQLLSSPNAYVVDAFAETINLYPLDKQKTLSLAQTYLKVLAPGYKMSPEEAEYLYRTVNYYQPNIQEPQRTITIIKSLVRNADKNFKEKNYKKVIESEHPYKKDTNVDFEIHQPDATSIQLNFSSFDTESGYDKVRIYDYDSGSLLDTFSGNKGRFDTKFYPTNHIKINFTSDNATNKQGFVISSVRGRIYKEVKFNREDVRTAIFKAIQIPRWLMDRDYSIIKGLSQKLEEDVVGVVEGKRDLVRLAKQGYAAGRTDEKPIASSLLVGPTGTGKSYIAKKLALFLDFKLITMDMTQYATRDSFDRFIEVMSNHLIINPYAMYLFEEIDKANVEVLDRLYFLLDEGLFYDKSQRPLFARGAFIMMTTNAAKDLIIQEKDNPELRKLVNMELQKHFRPSFLNRFDAMSIFYPFSEAEFTQLATIMLNKKSKRLKEYFGWSFSYDESTLRYCAQNGHSDLYGARPMERIIENVISNGIAEYQMEYGALDWGDQFSIEKHDSGENMFEIRVSHKKTLIYEVDPRNNSGHFFTEFLFGNLGLL